MPNLEIDNNRYKFLNKIRNEFPELLIPKVKFNDDPLPLRLYKYQTENGERLIQSSISQFDYTTHKYPGFKEFTKETLELLNTFCKTYKIEHLKRTGLRYINQINIDESSTLTDYLKIELHTPLKISPNDIMKHQYETYLRLDKGTLRLFVQLQQIDSKRVITLDFDYSIEKTDMKLENIKKYMEISHEKTKGVFLSLLTDKYRKSLKEIQR